jgi:hypothetical protein
MTEEAVGVVGRREGPARDLLDRLAMKNREWITGWVVPAGMAPSDGFTAQSHAEEHGDDSRQPVSALSHQSLNSLRY